MAIAEGVTEANRAIVRSFYEGGGRHDLAGFASQLSDRFEVFVPDYLPWGGRSDKTRYITWVIPQVARSLDFGRLKFDSLTAEQNHVVAFIEIGVKGTDDSILISEHWDLFDSKAVKLRVAYYEPGILLKKLGLPAL
ncbi:hypothetical protein JQ557_08615 [Bradyrhizobium sp. U87765 SZCCT0131]|uniref:hypothetical protein n=1 Tax=unclassified Bradyrhizobium TaxID=2631580 RepID=UPI001BA9B658|nr:MULTISPECIES: hypothetical protein [unclassified Bradyrhizobium]MBR1218048.1 hypothetical protein [Bradyrhizobium sp. U87765 SZCCT0131]MBR1261006.1 hypothetical protein [Bradyrhizobium sp. U87765 SZCCT0134]MBR1303546.1 hypothetical protein [Bradyrhizobium sp. U87765 SZCCT0110]MBR1319152.1 hypothetical protein [Bradyrhizobium sp. U87765 SZCCT0109]MBR1347477.1 hypothetical protein [Bradyrhizobium sp. U87765 SZCCT0048]